MSSTCLLPVVHGFPEHLRCLRQAKWNSSKACHAGISTWETPPRTWPGDPTSQTAPMSWPGLHVERKGTLLMAVYLHFQQLLEASNVHLPQVCLLSISSLVLPSRSCEQLLRS